VTTISATSGLSSPRCLSGQDRHCQRAAGGAAWTKGCNQAREECRRGDDVAWSCLRCSFLKASARRLLQRRRRLRRFRRGRVNVRNWGSGEKDDTFAKFPFPKWQFFTHLLSYLTCGSHVCHVDRYTAASETSDRIKHAQRL
jgi:hypothetical protein